MISSGQQADPFVVDDLSRPGRWRPVVAAGCVALFLASAWCRAWWQVDDAFIFQSYLRNVLEGGGLVYNAGQWVEGFSSPLWVALLWLLGSVGLDGIQGAKLVGLLLGAGSAAALVLAVPSRVPLWAAGLGGALLALSPAWAWWSVSGMETPLVGALTLALGLGLSRGRPQVVAVAAGLLAVTRPEGAIMTAAAILWFGFHGRHLLDRPGRRVLAGVLLVLPSCAVQLVRLVTYGAWLANSALAKLASPSTGVGPSSLAGVEYWAESLLRTPSLWVVLLGVVLIGGLGRSEQRAINLTVWFAVAATTLFVLLVRGDWMPWSRFWMPLLPLVLCWAAAQVRIPHQPSATASRSPAASGRCPSGDLLSDGQRRGVGAVMGVALLLCVGVQLRDFLPGYSVHPRSGLKIRAKVDYPGNPLVDPVQGQTFARVYLSALYRFTRPGDAVFHIDIGESGYFAGDLKVLDAYGLVAPTIADFLHGRMSNARFQAAMRAVAPTVVFHLLDRKTRRPHLRASAALEPLWRGGYTPVGRTPWWGHTELLILVRNDALGRHGDPARFARWQARSPGLTFSLAKIDAMAKRLRVPKKYNKIK